MVKLASRRTSWSAADLMAADFAEPRFAVANLIPEGLAFMCGAPKLGKSWMALGLSIAVAAGGRALGAVPVDAGDVLYLALEDSPRRLQARLRMLLAGDEAPTRLQLETEWPRLDEGGAEGLERWLDDHADARLVLVDVWPRIRPRVSKRSADQYTLDYDGAAQLQALAIARSIAIVALFHTRKATSEDFVETVTGTIGTAATADTIVVVKRSRGQADATLHVTGRDVGERELALRFAPEAGSWALLGDASEYAIGETRKELLDAVRAHGSLTPKQAGEITSVGYELAKKTMQRMAADGQLQGDRGTFRIPVPPVPLSPDAPDLQEQVSLSLSPQGQGQPAGQRGKGQRDTGDKGTPGTRGLVVSEDAPKRALSPLQSLQLLDTSRQERNDEPNDRPDQEPPWVKAGLSWRVWARRQHA